MTHDPSAKGLAGALGWPIAIVMGTAMLLGGFAGYNQAVADNGGQPAPAWLALVVALGSCGIAFAAYLRAYRTTWRQWSPRKRRYWFSLGLCGLVGGVIGGWFSAEMPYHHGLLDAAASTAFSPGFAVGASLLWLVGLSIGSLFYHRSIDDHEEHAWLWAGLAGWYAFALAAPVWWVLHRADLAPPADAMMLFLLSLIVNAVVHLWMKFR